MPDAGSSYDAQGYDATNDVAPPKDSGGGSDTGSDVTTPPQDAGADTNTTSDASDDASDSSAPVVTETVNVSGEVSMFPDAVFAAFYEDDVIVRVSTAPECVMHIRSGSKLASAVGNLTIGGDFIGQDGGYSTPQVVAPIIDANQSDDNTYAGFAGAPPLFYPLTGDLSVQISTQGTGILPALPVTTLHSPAVSFVTVTNPSFPDAGGMGNIDADHTKDFVVEWTVPDAGIADQRMSVSLRQIANTTHIGGIFCGYPLSAGKATIPAAVLTELWTRLGGADAGAAGFLGMIRLMAADQREVVVNGASYAIELGNQATGITFNVDVGFTLK